MGARTAIGDRLASRAISRHWGHVDRPDAYRGDRAPAAPRTSAAASRAKTGRHGHRDGASTWAGQLRWSGCMPRTVDHIIARPRIVRQGARLCGAPVWGARARPVRRRPTETSRRDSPGPSPSETGARTPIPNRPVDRATLAGVATVGPFAPCREARYQRPSGAGDSRGISKPLLRQTVARAKINLMEATTRALELSELRHDLEPDDAVGTVANDHLPTINDVSPSRSVRHARLHMSRQAVKRGQAPRIARLSLYCALSVDRC